MVEVQGSEAGDPDDLLAQDTSSCLNYHVRFEPTDGFYSIRAVNRADADRHLGVDLSGAGVRPSVRPAPFVGRV